MVVFIPGLYWNPFKHIAIRSAIQGKKDWSNELREHLGPVKLDILYLHFIANRNNHVNWIPSGNGKPEAEWKVQAGVEPRL